MYRLSAILILMRPTVSYHCYHNDFFFFIIFYLVLILIACSTSLTIIRKDVSWDYTGVIWMWFVCIAPLTHHQSWYWIKGPVKYCYPTFWSVITQHSFRDCPLFPHADPNQSFSIPPAHPLAADASASTDLTRKRKKKKRKGARAEAPTVPATNAAATWMTAMARPPRSRPLTHTHSHALTFTERKTLEWKSVSSKNLDPDERMGRMMARTLAKIYPSLLLTCY